MQGKNYRHITLQDVAQDAGVSRSTASLVVRGSKAIPAATSQKVLASMEKLGYVYDRVAANLRSKQSSTVGVIITEIGNPFFAELLVGIHDGLDEYGYTVILGTTFDSMTKQDRLLGTMLEHRICGLVISPVADSHKENFSKLQKLSTPLVFVGREISGMDADYVGADYSLGAQMAVQHLVEQGHARIALLGGIKGTSAYRERRKGYLSVLKIHSITPDETLLINAPATRQGGYQAMDALLNNPVPATAALCHNDIVAIGAMQRLRDSGLVAGRDFAIVGFDNIQEAAPYYPGLTSVSIEARQWGLEAAKLLHKRISGANPGTERIILPSRLIIRDSSLRNKTFQ